MLSKALNPIAVRKGTSMFRFGRREIGEEHWEWAGEGSGKGKYRTQVAQGAGHGGVT